MWPNPQLSADLVTFTEEILNGKLHFLCSAIFNLRAFWGRAPHSLALKLTKNKANTLNLAGTKNNIKVWGYFNFAYIDTYSFKILESYYKLVTVIQTLLLDIRAIFFNLVAVAEEEFDLSVNPRIFPITNLSRIIVKTITYCFWFFMSLLISIWRNWSLKAHSQVLDNFWQLKPSQNNVNDFYFTLKAVFVYKIQSLHKLYISTKLSKICFS